MKKLFVSMCALFLIMCSTAFAMMSSFGKYSLKYNYLVSPFEKYSQAYSQFDPLQRIARAFTKKALYDEEFRRKNYPTLLALKDKLFSTSTPSMYFRTFPQQRTPIYFDKPTTRK